MTHSNGKRIRETAGKALIAVLPLFACLQFTRFEPKGNPAVNSDHTIEAMLDVPDPVSAILDKACNDCHSNETRWPLYAKVAPVSWMMRKDVERGRRAMNFSEWAERPTAKPAVAIGYLVAACADVTSQHMPPASYKRMHPRARLTADDKQTLCDWTSAQTSYLRGRHSEQRSHE